MTDKQAYRLPTVNRVELCGTVAEDPIMRAQPDGRGVLAFSLDTGEPFSGPVDEWEGNTTHIHCLMHNDVANHWHHKLKVGTVFIGSGRIAQINYEDKTDRIRRRLEVLIHDGIVLEVAPDAQ